MNPSYAFDPDVHQPGSVAATGRCSWHGGDDARGGECEGDAVVSFQDDQGQWQSGCQRALEDLVKKGDRAVGTESMSEPAPSASELDELEIFDKVDGRLACRVCGALVLREGDYARVHRDWHEAANGA